MSSGALKRIATRRRNYTAVPAVLDDDSHNTTAGDVARVLQLPGGHTHDLQYHFIRSWVVLRFCWSESFLLVGRAGPIVLHHPYRDCV